MNVCPLCALNQPRHFTEELSHLMPAQEAAHTCERVQFITHCPPLAVPWFARSDSLDDAIQPFNGVAGCALGEVSLFPFHSLIGMGLRVRYGGCVVLRTIPSELCTSSYGRGDRRPAPGQQA